uniref:Protein N-terminal glutamine amidohydrolase n=1 Tax=Zea mays TaxID=4577 RepID=A0A804Q0A7_MAIZE
MDGGRAAAVGGDPSPIAAPSNPPALSSRPVDVSSFTHTPCYCEENVYMLCNELIRTGVADPAGTDLYVVFISNEEKKVIYCLFFYCWRSYFPSVGNFPSIQVPLWHQKAGHSDDGFICWDYHVICIQCFMVLLDVHMEV